VSVFASKQSPTPQSGAASARPRPDARRASRFAIDVDRAIDVRIPSTLSHDAPSQPRGHGYDLTRIPANSLTSGIHGIPTIVRDVLRSPGQPLDTTARGFFEPRFGHDFSQVRIHTDQRAAESARSVGADAYAVGRDLVFGDRQFSPRSVAGRKLLAHELAHVVQQTATPAAPNGRFAVSVPGDSSELEADRISNVIFGATSMPRVSLRTPPVVVARRPSTVREATDEDRRSQVDAAARFLAGMADQVEALRRVAAVALRTTQGHAAAARAFHQHLNQGVLGRLLNNAISVFEAQRSDNPHINFPSESPEQTRLGEAFALVMAQIGSAIEEARANAANLAPAVRSAEEIRSEENHLRWFETNPSAPLGAGVRRTFTRAEVDLSARRHQQMATELANLTARFHEQDLSGNRAERLRRALLDATYRLVRDPATDQAQAQPDAAMQATVRPLIDQLAGISWAISQAVARLQLAESRTRAFAGDPAANQPVGNTLQAHFSTRDPGYAGVLSDRLGRMARELRGEGALKVHARDPQDRDCGVGSVGGGLSIVAAHAGPNRFHFCGLVTVGDAETVSTVVHETAHAVIPNLGASGAVTPATSTPRDRAYAYERIYSRLSTEEALDNAESYAFYVDAVVGAQVQRPSAPDDIVTGCADVDADTVRNAIARATYRIRLGAIWADQTAAEHRGADLPQGIVDIVREGFPGADVARARAILMHLRDLASTLNYSLRLACRPGTDGEARAGALVYGRANRVTATAVAATSAKYPAGTLRVCPAWFRADTPIREDALTSLLILHYRSAVPTADVRGFVALVRRIQEGAHPSVAGRTLPQHQAADAPPVPRP
jgi:Domain of unknown function (DUF4157)